MAYSKVPTTWLGAGYTLATNIAGFTTATGSGCIAQLTDTEADPATGDIRKIFFALCDMMYEAQQDITVGDRPTKMTIYKSGTLSRTYTFRFELDASTVEVSDE